MQISCCEVVTMIDLTINEGVLQKTIVRARERNIIIPTFAQLCNPEKAPKRILEELQNIGLWDIVPQNLFRISWKNEPIEFGGKFGGVNYVEFPPELTGVEARIIALIGKWFPTGAHKVGATFGCLVPKLVTGQFDPTSQKAVWPSTGNYARGGAYDATLLGCESIAILPEGMSKERFDWLKSVAGEIIRTPGSESNVKEIFDKCWEILRTRPDEVVIFNQFKEFGNHLFHYAITGQAMAEVLQRELHGREFRGVCLGSGSAGTLGCGDYLKEVYPNSKIVAGEALQCPTMLINGYGSHRIEGIGDKHIPWIHNVRNTDMVIAIDDNDCMNLMRLFNEPDGKKYLQKQGLDEDLVANLNLLGISGIANMLMCIKFAKFHEFGSKDVVLTVLTDSMAMYQSRLVELRSKYGVYTENHASIDLRRSLIDGIKADNMISMNYWDKRRVHNLKYYTWIEQQAANLQELNRQWDDPSYWEEIHNTTGKIDELIISFNEKVGLA